MAPAPLSAGFQSLPPLPTIKLGPSGAASPVGGLVYTLGPLWVSLTNCPVRLGVSPAAAPAPTGVFNQRFEALFSLRWSPVLRGLSPGSPAAALPASCCLASQLQPCPPHSTICHPLGLATLLQVLSAQLPISAPPTGLGECFFFISLVVGLSYSSIFCQFWLFFVFKFVVLLLVVRGGTVCLPMPASWPEV